MTSSRFEKLLLHLALRLHRSAVGVSRAYSILYVLRAALPRPCYLAALALEVATETATENAGTRARGRRNLRKSGGHVNAISRGLTLILPRTRTDRSIIE